MPLRTRSARVVIYLALILAFGAFCFAGYALVASIKLRNEGIALKFDKTIVAMATPNCEQSKAYITKTAQDLAAQENFLLAVGHDKEVPPPLAKLFLGRAAQLKNVPTLPGINCNQQLQQLQRILLR